MPPLQATPCYERHTSPAFQVVGSSAVYTAANYDSVLAAVWEEFAASTATAGLTGMEDARIYTVQTGTLEADGGKITVGVRLPADAAVPSGLQSTRVEAADFAVFAAAEPPTEQLAASWARIALSSIEPSHDAVVEAWEFNA